MYFIKKTKIKIQWLTLAIVFLFISNAHAQEISREAAERIIISEAADQGLKGMICVGEVLRHRGGVKGFYGYRYNRKHQPKSVWNMAGKAWDLSATTNYTNGADHFENIHRFGSPRWAKNCIKTYQYKDHVFYKEIYPIRSGHY